MATPDSEPIITTDGLTIRLLGGFQVSVGPRIIDDAAWRRRKGAAIVKLLALAPRHQLRREQITDLLWRDFEPQAAANNLRRTLHAARRVLDPCASSPLSYLQGDPLTLNSDGPLWVDVEAFEAAAGAARRSHDPADYDHAISLYAGDLLPDDRYDDWATDRREDLRRTYLALLIELARLYEEQEQLARTVEVLKRVIACDPAHEDAHAALMRLYACSGHRYQALLQYHLLSDSLLREVDAEPDLATRQLYEELLEQRFVRPSDEATRSGATLHRHNLPVPVTSFIGREREMGEVTRLLDQARLLTLTGSGGCGKTRLAIEAASRLVDAYRDGAWLVDLAPLPDPELVPQTIAAVLSVQEQPGVRLSQTLANALENRHILLLLDNCEHLIQSCAALADTLLCACGHLRILATSRRPLKIAGEQVWRVPSLELPSPRGLQPLSEIARAEAVRLFLDRARLSRVDFALTESNAPAVVEVCHRLDGMPLAIELAAARLRALGIGQIGALLDDRFRLLTDGSRAALPRQQTLRATVDWSYDLLEPAEQALFDRMSVFAGGWTLDAARAICADPVVESDRVVDLLSRLVDQSLVSADEEGDGTMRYRMLETLRQHGREQLAAGGKATTVHRRHAAHYLALAEEAEPELTGPRQVAWLDRLEREHDNLRAAIRWALDAGELDIATRLCAALGWLWYEHSHLTEGRRWLESVRSLGGELPQPIQAKLLMWAGLFAGLQGAYLQAQHHLSDSLRLWRSVGDRRHQALVLNMLGSVARYEDDAERAMAMYEAAVPIAQDAGDARNLALSVHHLGDIARIRGDFAKARTLYQKSLTLARELGDHRRVALTLARLASVAAHEGDIEQAAALCREGLEIGRIVGSKTCVAKGLYALAETARAEGQAARAARLLSAATALLDATGSPVAPIGLAAYDCLLGSLRECLGQAQFAAAWDEGQAMVSRGWDEIVADALEP